MKFVAPFYKWNGGNSLIYDINKGRQNGFLPIHLNIFPLTTLFLLSVNTVKQRWIKVGKKWFEGFPHMKC